MKQNYLVCPQPGKLYRNLPYTYYFRPLPGINDKADTTMPIRRVSHKRMPKLMTRRQIRRNISRSKFIIKHNL